MSTNAAPNPVSPGRRQRWQWAVVVGCGALLVVQVVYLWVNGPGNLWGPPPERLPAPRFAVDINTAGPAELEQLPGIGPKLAAEIIRHRTQHGPFRRPEDLLDVRGIGEGNLARLRPFLAPAE